MESLQNKTLVVTTIMVSRNKERRESNVVSDFSHSQSPPYSMHKESTEKLVGNDNVSKDTDKNKKVEKFAPRPQSPTLKNHERN